MLSHSSFSVSTVYISSRWIWTYLNKEDEIRAKKVSVEREPAGSEKNIQRICE